MSLNSSILEERVTDLLNPRSVAEPDLPGWVLLQGVWHHHRYSDSGPPAELCSLRDENISRVLEALKLDIPPLFFAERYIIHTYPGRDHGQHWHRLKVELMTVIMGMFSFTVSEPFGDRRQEIFISGNKAEEKGNRALLVLPGTMHSVRALEPNSVLQVYSTTEHVDGDHPDAYNHWLEDLDPAT